MLGDGALIAMMVPVMTASENPSPRSTREAAHSAALDQLAGIGGQEPPPADSQVDRSGANRTR